jgi:bleomycin hydrolase
MKSVALFLSLVIVSGAFCQNPNDKAVFLEGKPGYFQKDILTGIEKFDSEIKKTPPLPRRFKMDMSKLDIPKDLTLYKKQWHNDPVSQGNTNTCWGFSTISFLESEVFRISKKKVRLSEMYIVYHEYIEKARYFVKTRGASAFAEGSESNAVTRMMKMYGIVPYEAYSGLKDGQPFHSHAALFKELSDFLSKVKQNGNWNEEWVLETIKSIMNDHIGKPPTVFKVEGKDSNPMDYMKNVIKLNPDDYVDFMSLMEIPYYKKAEYKVPDNWWNNADYYNVPLDEYMNAIKNAIRNGYTIAIGGDVSEPGLDPEYQAAVVPDFDVPGPFINEFSRQMRFTNGSSTDDHGLHLVGFCEKNGQDWYLIKDSGAGSRNCGKGHPCFGYYFFREDYVKLKMLSFTVHKDAVKELLNKCHGDQ